jgi:hypothetical protein
VNIDVHSIKKLKLKVISTEDDVLQPQLRRWNVQRFELQVVTTHLTDHCLGYKLAN